MRWRAPSHICHLRPLSLRLVRPPKGDLRGQVLALLTAQGASDDNRMEGKLLHAARHFTVAKLACDDELFAGGTVLETCKHHRCQGRSKTRPLGRSKSRPVFAGIGFLSMRGRRA